MAEQSCLYGSAGNSKVYAQKPYYNGYTPLPSLFEPKVAWAEDKPAQSGNVVEIVCSPNNPDGKMQTKQLPSELLRVWGNYYLHTAQRGLQAWVVTVCLPAWCCGERGSDGHMRHGMNGYGYAHQSIPAQA